MERELDENKFTMEKLEKCTYRNLQQMGKAMALPSNVKKIYLIKLIYTKVFGTQREVDNIIDQVRRERQQSAISNERKRGSRRGRRLQGEEISSTSDNHTYRSPPIVVTPKRQAIRLVRYSPEKTFTNTTSYPINRKHNCDRVLRTRTYPSIKYRDCQKVFNLNDEVYSVVRKKSPEPRKDMNKRNVNCVNVKTKYVMRQRSLVNSGHSFVERSVCNQNVITLNNDRDNVNFMSSDLVIPSARASRKKRTISGIYPINNSENKPTNYEYIQSGLGIKKTDGTYTRINAIIQKPLETVLNNSYFQETVIQERIKTKALPQVEVRRNNSSEHVDFATQCPNLHSMFVDTHEDPTSSIQIPTSISTPIFTTTSDINTSFYSTFNTYTHSNNNSTIMNNSSDFTNSIDSSFQENKLTKRIREYEDLYCDIETPNLSSGKRTDLVSVSTDPMFTYNERNDVVTSYCHKKIRAEQVRTHRKSILNYKVDRELLPRIHEAFNKFNDLNRNEREPFIMQSGNVTAQIPGVINSTHMLETLYNFKNDFVTTLPYFRTVTTSNTTIVYSTPLITTAKCSESSSFVPNNESNQPSYDGPHEDLYSYLQNEQRDSVRRSIRQSMDFDVSQLDETMFDSDMVDDALELISQDGDYLERIVSEYRACMFCPWAGDELHRHVTQEHENSIQRSGQPLCYGVAALRAGVCRALRATAGQLVVLRAAVTDGRLNAVLQCISEVQSALIGSITIYNRVSGAPYTWSGPIQLLDQALDLDLGLDVSLDQLSLVPDYNLDRHYVHYSHGIVFGEQSLDDVQIVIHVKV